jgi:hypothetical protein
MKVIRFCTRIFFQPLFTSPVRGSNILLSIPFLNTPKLCSLLNVRDTFGTTGKLKFCLFKSLSFYVANEKTKCSQQIIVSIPRI